MNSKSDLNEMTPHDLADYGFARARDVAFDAVKELWKRRRSEGMKQIDLANILKRDPGWISKALRGPGNWTMRTFGELVAGMGGEIEIAIHAIEDPLPERPNYHAYAGYELQISEPTEGPNMRAQTVSTSYSTEFSSEQFPVASGAA
jgi:hypothetical protein